MSVQPKEVASQEKELVISVLKGAEAQLERTQEQLKVLAEEVGNYLVNVRSLVSRLEGCSEDSARSFKFDKTKDGWTKLEDVEPRISSVKGLELLSFLKRGESYVNGEAMKRRAEEQKANFGQLDAEWLFEHQDQIPKEFRKYYLAFPGTVWQDPYGDRRVAYLYWSDDQWCLNFSWLGNVWNSDYRLLCLSK